MRKPKKKLSIEEAREKAWKKINQRGEEILERRRNGKEIPAKVLPHDPYREMRQNWKAGADMVLWQAEHCCKSKKEKLEYFNFALECLYSLPSYQLRKQIDEAEKKNDAEEYLRNPKCFEKNNRYYKVDDPAEIIQAEIDRLEGRGAEPIRPQGIKHWEVIEELKKNPQLPITCSTLRANAGINPGTFRRWHRDGKKINSDFDLKDWKKLGGDTAPRTGNLLLKVSKDKTTVIGEDLLNFLRFIGRN